MQPVRMECVISSLLGGLGDQDLLGMTDKNQVGLRMSSATFNSSQKLYSRLPYLNNALNDKTLLRKLSHGAASSISALSLRFVFSVTLIEATIQCAGWVLHQLAVCAAQGEALKRMVSTQGCGWIREMGSAESCCVVWPLNGLRVDCGGQLADGVAVQGAWGGGWDSARSTDCQMTHLARTMLASVGAPPFTFCVLIPIRFMSETFIYCWFWIIFFLLLQYLPLRRKISLCFGCHVSPNTHSFLKMSQMDNFWL